MKKMVVKEVIDILKSRNRGNEEKEAAYESLVSNLKNDSAYEEQFRTHKTELLKVLCQDIQDGEEKLTLNALHVLHFCLQNGDAESLSKSESDVVLKSLIQCGSKATSVDIIKQIFDCLSVERFHQEVLANEISSLLDFTEEMNSKAKAKSAFILDKIISFFVRLEKQIGKNLKASSPRWARLIFPGLINVSQEVREDSVSLLEKFRVDLSSAPDLSKHIIKALSAGLAKSLKGLMPAHEAYVLRVWPLIVQVTGKELHRGSTINSLLEIIEMGFKSSHTGRLNAFIAWRSLIDNFSLDKALISDSKRIKLLLMVLKVDNAKVETVALEKLRTWWHFCSCLGSKLAVNFEMIVYPLLQFCVANEKLQPGADLGQAPRLALKTSTTNSPLGLHQSSPKVKTNLPIFFEVQKLGCEIIAHLISKVGKSDDLGKVVWTLAPLCDEVLGSPAVFVKHAPIIMAALHKLLTNVGNQIEENLMLHIWISVGNHLKAAVDSSVKTECRDIFSTYLSILHSVVQNQLLESQTILKMIQVSCSFPQKVLASTAYNITGGQTVHGCPAQLLSELLLSAYMIKHAGAHENFIKLFSTLVNAGASNLPGALQFLQTVTEMLDSQASLLPSPECVWRLWSTLAHTLQDTINTTNEVNQGDALEYSFGCMYTVLHLPIKHQLSSKISQVVSKALLKLWKELYHSFARLSALVATAEANTCLEEMSAKIIQNWCPEFKEAVNLEFLSNICQKMIECVDFSATSINQSPGSGLTLSPGKWLRKRQRPLGNFHSFVHLLAKLQTEWNVLYSETENTDFLKKQTSAGSVTLVAHTLVDVYVKLFTHISSASVISNCLAVLASPLARLYQPNTKLTSVKLFVPSFFTKLEKLWQEIAQCVTGRYSGPYDTEFLNCLCPLLEATLEHPRRIIRNQSLTLWNTTFGRMPGLEYPNSLKNTIMKVKETRNIILPGCFSNDEVAVVAETPFSEMSTGDSQLPVPVLPQLASPKRQKGSLLNRDLSPARQLSPKPRASPAKVVSPKEVRKLFAGTRKRIDLELFPKEDFVVIESPVTKTKRLLTEHQKEVLKQKSVLPAMYSNVEGSQDVSLMSQFGTETQQSLDVIVIHSSESPEQANQNLFKADHTGNQEENADIAFHISGNLQPHALTSSVRRSVRIQELQSSNSVEIITDYMTTPEDTNLSTKPDFLQTENSCTKSEISDNLKKNIVSKNEKDIPKQQSSEEASNFTSDVCEASREMTNVFNKPLNYLTSAIGQKNVDAPFVMFRTVQQTDCPISLSQNTVTTTSPRRISLRKVRSQDDIPLSKLVKEVSKDTSSPNDSKLPRRVPLKKVNEQENQPNSENFSHGALPKSSDGFDCSTSSIVNKVNEPSDHFNSVAEENDDSDSCANVSCTLVEDTQSPFKLKPRVPESSHMITETPVKSDSSTSPPVRVASARKLFADGDTDSMTQIPTANTDLAVESKVGNVDNKNEKPLLLDNVEMPSSQGFDVACDKSSNRKDQNALQSLSSDNGNECFESVQCTSDADSVPLPGSEALFSGTEASSAAIDMFIPTLATAIDHMQTVSEMSNSDESHKTSITSTDESQKQETASSESDLLCLQSTLADDVQASTPNKRKQGTPKKMSLIKDNRMSKRHRKDKGSQSCKSFKLSDHSKSKSAKSDSSASITSQESVAVTELPSSADEVFVSDSPLDAEDSEEVFIKVKVSGRALQEIGEVTPDIKSPKSNPERRHSTVKRMGKTQKRKLENASVSKSLAPNKMRRLQSVESDNSNNVCEEVKRFSGADWRNKLKLGSPVDKKKSVSPHLSKLGKRSYNKLDVLSGDGRSSSIYKIEPQVDTSKHSDDEDELPLSYFKKCKENYCDETNREDKNKDVMIFTDAEVETQKSTDAEIDMQKSTDAEVVDTQKSTDAEVETQKSTDAEIDMQKSTDAEVVDTQKSTDAEVETQKSTDAEIDMQKSTDAEVVDTQKSTDAEVDTQKSTDAEIDTQKSIDAEVDTQKSTDAEVDTQKSTDAEVDTQKSTDAEVDTQKSTDAEVDTQKSDNNADSMVYSETDVLLIDATVNRAIERVLAESSVLICHEKDVLSAECTKDSTVEGSSSASPASVLHELPQAGQLLISPETESEEPEKSMNIPAMEKVVHMESDEVFTDEKTLDCISLEDVCSEHQQTENVMVVNHPQTETEVAPGEVKKTNPVEDKTQQQNLNKVCSDSVDPDKGEDTAVISRECDSDMPIPRSPQPSACVYSWSPTRSPTCSILKKSTETPPGGKNLRVSFAEPVVNGESPVRQRFAEFIPTSPLISAQTRSPGQKASHFNKLQGRSPRYRSRLESCIRQEPVNSRLVRRIVSPQTQLSFRPTQESQLNNCEPIFPELVNCTNPLDDILPQLTSSQWYRGLCQLMKGRNVNTIGDLSSLTEVQIDQLPIRHPKVEIVKSTLHAYMIQHGLGKIVDNTEEMLDSCKSPRSKGSTIEQEVTPASIDDEEVQVHPNADEDLKQFSPIIDTESGPPRLLVTPMEMDAYSSSTTAAEPSTTGDSSLHSQSPSQMLLDLKDMVKTCSVLKKANIVELFEIHQTLNLLFTNVVEEMKARQPTA